MELELEKLVLRGVLDAASYNCGAWTLYIYIHM